MASTIEKVVHQEKGEVIDDLRPYLYKNGRAWTIIPPGIDGVAWTKNEWVNSPPYYFYDNDTGLAYPITASDEISIEATGLPMTGGCAGSILNGDTVENYCAKLKLDKWDAATQRGISMVQTHSLVYQAGLNYSCGGRLKAKEGDLNCPGVFVDVTISFLSNNAPRTVISATTRTFEHMGVEIEENADGTFSKVKPEWTDFYDIQAVPVGTLYVEVEFYFYQTYILTMDKVFVDDFDATSMNAAAYKDSYLIIDREVMKFDMFVYGQPKSYFHIPYDGRAQRGTLNANHKNKEEGKIAKIIGGETKTIGHPLNILLRLLMTTGRGTDLYDPSAHMYDAGDGFGRGLATAVPDVPVHGDDRDNLLVDVEAIEALRDDTSCGYDTYLAEFRFTKGIKDFKEWSEAEIMRPFGFRWVPGENGKISVARVAPLWLDEERAGSMASGVFTPTVAPQWYSNLWYRASGPSVYLWVKELNQTFLVTANTASTITVASPPADGAYTCAILPKPKTSTYPYCAEIGEREWEAIPDVTYDTNIINKITWKFDYDPSNTVDNRHNSRHLTLEEYDESSFYGLDFWESAESSYSRHELQNMDIKSSGLRGAASSKLANGYNLNGNKVARRVTYDNLRKWREQLPRIKGTLGLTRVNLDAGDCVRIKHSKMRDSRTGVTGIDKICQIDEVRHDLMKKKITIICKSFSDVHSPPLLAPFTVPTVQDYFMNIKHPTIETIKSLKIRDYPFYVGNLYFVRQTYSATSVDDAKTRTWTTNRATGLWTPQDEIDYQNGLSPGSTPQWYRHTNVYVSHDGATWEKVAETREPYIFFAWEADDTKKNVLSLYVKFSYSTPSYDPLTGEFQETSRYPGSPEEQTAIDKYRKGFVGVNLQKSNEESAMLRAVERITADRLYSKLKGSAD